MHGVTKPVSMPAELKLQQGKLVGKSAFSIKPSDYNIKIPSLVKDKIAAEIPVQVSAEFLPK
jgi:polyisoprenoid-binding protein YceI